MQEGKSTHYPYILIKRPEIRIVPNLKRKKASGTPGEWYINIPNYGAGPPVYTLQVRSSGRDILLSSDLDHDNTPKRTAYVDWELYGTLDDLDLLYTKGEDSNSASSELQPADDRPLESLTPKQRVAFASSLVKRTPVERLVESIQILELFQSLSLDISGHEMLLAAILEGTPFEPATIFNLDMYVDKYAPARSPDVEAYDVTLLALVIKFVFGQLVSTSGALFDSVIRSRECCELWLFGESFAVGGNKLLKHSVAEYIQQRLPEVDREHLRADSLNITGPLSNPFVRTIYPSLSKGQLQTELVSYGTTVEDEVQTGCLFLFPKPVGRSDSELQTSFDEIEDRRWE